jgi:hypothetical protein
MCFKRNHLIAQLDALFGVSLSLYRDARDASVLELGHSHVMSIKALYVLPRATNVALKLWRPLL